MHPIQLNDELYREAQRRATEGGFESVDAYVANVVQLDLEDAEGIERMFTPERLAQIDRAAAEIEAGLGLTTKEADAELAQRREQWLRDRG